MLQIITTREELQETINFAVSSAVALAVKQMRNEDLKTGESDEIIEGMPGLCSFLHISAPTANRIKKLNLFPVYQVGRIIKFKKSEVLEGMKKIKPLKKSGKNV